MKFRFELTGKEVFAYFLAVILISVGLNFFTTYMNKTITNETDLNNSGMKLLYMIIALILYAIIMIICQFYIYKKSINALYFNEMQFNFKGNLGEFIWINISSLFLLIITLLLYFPKYIQRLVKYSVNNINYNNNNFDFYGKASNLFVKMLFTFFIPVILVTILIIKLTSNLEINESLIRLIIMLISFIIYMPLVFLLYKWIIQIKYLNCNITLKANFLNSVLFLLAQMLLSVFTLFIYFPAAYIKICQYFLPKINIENVENISFQIKTDFIIFDSWKFLWGQILLSLITLGIYFPWAYCKIAKYIFDRLAVEQI